MRARFDLPALRAAYDAQWAATVAWVRALPAEDWARPSVLGDWTVHDLAFHVTDMTGVVVRALAEGTVRQRAQSIAEYTAKWQPAAREIADREATKARTLDRDGVLAHATEARADLLSALDGMTGDPVIAGRRGPLRLSDLMATRVNELVVHSRDLSASLPDHEPIELVAPAVAVSCRMLLGILAERAPGTSVEVRVPPYAAVHAVAGPRHTRGTPSNVVEADPLTWIELATGRLTWREALERGGLSASGGRADLSALLPLLA